MAEQLAPSGKKWMSVTEDSRPTRRMIQLMLLATGWNKLPYIIQDLRSQCERHPRLMETLHDKHLTAFGLIEILDRRELEWRLHAEKLELLITLQRKDDADDQPIRDEGLRRTVAQMFQILQDAPGALREHGRKFVAFLAHMELPASCW